MQTTFPAFFQKLTEIILFRRNAVKTSFKWIEILKRYINPCLFCKIFFDVSLSQEETMSRWYVIQSKALSDRPLEIKTPLLCRPYFSTKRHFSMQMCLINETCLLLRPLSTSTIGGTSQFLTFLYLVFLCCSFYSFLISTLYSKAKVAAACAGIIYFLTYVPYMYVAIKEDVAGDSISSVVKTLVVSYSFSHYPAGTKSKLAFATSIEPSQRYSCSLSRLYTVGWPAPILSS